MFVGQANGIIKTPASCQGQIRYAPVERLLWKAGRIARRDPIPRASRFENVFRQTTTGSKPENARVADTAGPVTIIASAANLMAGRGRQSTHQGQRK